jgi:hypothetical protein
MTFHAFLKDDEFVKSPKGLFSVIPAQAGIQSFSVLGIPLDSRFHENDDFLRDHQRFILK